MDSVVGTHIFILIERKLMIASTIFVFRRFYNYDFQLEFRGKLEEDQQPKKLFPLTDCIPEKMKLK